MTTNENAAGANLDKLNENLARVEQLSTRFAEVMSHHKPMRRELTAPDDDVFASAANAYMQSMMHNPAKMLEHQMEFWTKSVTHFVDAQHMLMQGKLEAAPDETPSDRRFSNPLWQSHPYFNFVKQQYMRNTDVIRQAVADAEGLDGKDRQRLEYFSQQIIDMMSPTNFLGTNPDVLEKAIETDGESLVKGLENLIADLEANNGELIVRQAGTGKDWQFLATYQAVHDIDGGNPGLDKINWPVSRSGID